MNYPTPGENAGRGQSMGSGEGVSRIGGQLVVMLAPMNTVYMGFGARPPDGAGKELVIVQDGDTIIERFQARAYLGNLD